MAFKVENNAASTVDDNPLSASVVTLNVAAGEGANFPSSGNFRLTIWDASVYPDPGDDSGMEIVECTSRATDALTIVRAKEGTGDVAHAQGEKVALLLTAGLFDDSTQGIYSTFVEDSDFTAADEIMVGTGAGTHNQITLSASEFLAKKAAGAVTNVDASEARTILNVTDNADETNATNVASTIHGVTAKTPPVDDDEVGLIDSADTNTLKRLTWVNIKAALKTYFDTLYIGSVADDTTPQLTGDLDLMGYEILMNSTPGDDLTGSGIKASFQNDNAGNMVVGDVGYIASDGHVEFAKADAVGTMPGIVIALATIATTASGDFMIHGVVRQDTWNWTPGANIYVSTTGTSTNTLTATAPSGSGEQVQIVGIALTADTILFNPSPIVEAIP